MNATSASFEELNKQLSEIAEKLKVSTDNAARGVLLKQFRVLLNQAENSVGQISLKWDDRPPAL